MKVFAVQLNDAIVAVADNEPLACRMADAVKNHETETPGRFTRYVFVREFELNEWPEQWAPELGETVIPVSQSDWCSMENLGLKERLVHDLDPRAPEMLLLAAESVYCNLYHDFDEEVHAWLLEVPNRLVAHTAWDYWGGIWKDGDVYHEQIHVRGIAVAEYTSNDLKALIAHVVKEHGET